MSNKQKSDYSALSAAKIPKGTRHLIAESNTEDVTKCTHIDTHNLRKSEIYTKAELKVGKMSPKETISHGEPKRSHTLADTYNQHHYARKASTTKSNEIVLSHSFTKADHLSQACSRKKTSLLPNPEARTVLKKSKPQITIDMSKVPKRLRNLHRSNRNNQSLSAWTSSLSGVCVGGDIETQTGIILTDISLNQTPDLVLSVSSLSRQNSAKSLSFPFKKKLNKKNEENNKPCPSKNNLQIDRSGPTSLWDRFKEPFSNLKSTKSNIGDLILSDNMEWGKSSHRGPLITTNYEKTKQKEETQVPIVEDFYFMNHSNQDYKEELKLKSNDGIHTNWTILDLQREKEREELPPSRYIDDIKFCHHIHRREMISKLLYREEGQLFYRRGPRKDPIPPLPKSYLLAGANPAPPLKRNLKREPFPSEKEIKNVLQKVPLSNEFNGLKSKWA